MDGPVSQIPAVILSAEYIFGGLVRLSTWPFPNLHERVCRKNEKIAPILYPVVPFTDVVRHNRWVGFWMATTGLLWVYRSTRGSNVTLGMSLFWTSAGAYSQWRAGMPFWLPIVNFTLSWIVWWIENRKMRLI